MSKATRALGTTLSKGEQAIGGLTSIGGIEITADEIDVTTLDSDGGYKEFIGGFKDAGKLLLKVSLIQKMKGNLLCKNHWITD